MMYLEQRLEAIEKKLDLFLTLIGNDTKPMNVKAIAKMYGKSRTSMYGTNRYLLPNFGFGADGKNTVSEWTRKEVIEWNSISIEARKTELKNRVLEVN